MVCYKPVDNQNISSHLKATPASLPSLTSFSTQGHPLPSPLPLLSFSYQDQHLSSEIRVAKWSYARLGLWKLFVLFRLCKLSAHFHDLEQARSTSFSAVLSLERQRIQYLLYSRGALGKLYNLIPPQSLETVSSFVRVKNLHLQYCYSCTRLIFNLNMDSLSFWEGLWPRHFRIYSPLAVSDTLCVERKS